MKGFIADYLRYTESQEATERVHRWVALATIAGALERKVWLPRGHYTLFPNLYTFIIGPSGVVRKSSSTAIGVDMLREIDTVRLMSERLTAASLIQQFARSQKSFDFQGRTVKQCATFSYAQELNVFLSEVFGSIVELLTTFYDCIPNDADKPWVYESVSGGTTRVFGPCLNLLGACTPAWLVRSLPPTEMEGGFASRVIFVVEDSARRAIGFPDREIVTLDQVSRRQALVADLKRIHSLIGPMQLDDKVVSKGQIWYELHQKSLKSNADLRFSGYYGRKLDTVLKVAMLLVVSESSELYMRERHFDESLALLADVEKRMFDLFGSHGTNPDSMITDRVWNVIATCRKLTMAQLASHFRRDANINRLAQIVEHLMAMRRVVRVQDPGSKDIIVGAIDPEKPL